MDNRERRLLQAKIERRDETIRQLNDVNRALAKAVELLGKQRAEIAIVVSDLDTEIDNSGIPRSHRKALRASTQRILELVGDNEKAGEVERALAGMKKGGGRPAEPEKTKRIIALIDGGASREEAAEAVGLSVSGVDHHLRKAPFKTAGEPAY